MNDNNIVWHNYQVDKSSRVKLKDHKPCIIWFTGLSGSGKSTVANALEQSLNSKGIHTYLLDGDNIRHGLCSDLGFSEQDRQENIRRVGEVAKLMIDAGLIVLSAFISPSKAERDAIREHVEEHEFIEVYLDTPFAVCEQRDPKGLYKKARSGGLSQFTGIDSDYEKPDSPELIINTEELAVEDAVELLITELLKRKLVSA